MSNAPRYMLGVDLGTTSTKTVVFTLDGKVVAQHAEEYPVLCTEPGMAEQDPQQIYEAALDSIAGAVKAARAAPQDIALLSFSAAMHSVIALDADNGLLSNSITWGDIRASVWAERIRKEFDGNAIYRRTGTPIHPMSPLCKLMWMRHEKPEVFGKAARFVGIKEYLMFRLFGEWVVDHSIASATGMFNLRELAWDREALALLQVDAAQLPKPVPTTYRLPALQPEMAQRLGLSTATPFIIGANDGVLSNLGVNAIETGHVAVTIGTSGAMRTVIDRPLTDPHGRLFCYALTEKHWVVGGPVNNGGNIFRWVRDELATAEAAAARDEGVDPYEALTRIAEKVMPGAEGLLFHPFLAGERAPLWNADLRGSFFGLGLHHGKHHMIRAALEGVIFNLYSILPALEDLVGPTKRMMATGGFARSALWRQMMADIFNREVMVPESVESSCLGAAVLGAYALGLVDSLEAISGMVGSNHHHAPQAAAVKVYSRLQPIFAAIPAKLEAEYHAIAAFQREMVKPE
ncbi:MULTISPECIES: gluconokinase [unclassified Herbaspirillum]|uniref:gluconokinase n=1 Tax=unclassified Herbaspirillum TaxID=2624150 RepID=UPI00114E639C|nr:MULTISPECIES: gluconokinase [unclassified Herbaspirillum]MBB5390708.1 gluconokinase [Herbaspirillum sp. SJZ102]TQK08807.1 gluconate kinase (FGGY family) [Herbaspirillum sp. SJZ130]TQK14506.1 gluconate kinase (FGGY family) [Herbaspirillum sp. SJZ106]